MATERERGLAVLTGASSGLGKAIAHGLASEGWSLMLLGRHVDEALCAELVHRGARLVAPNILDLSVSENLEGLPTKLGALPVDLLVNCAGMVHDRKGIEGLDLAEQECLFRLNVLAPMVLMQAVLPGMRARRHGTIVNITSYAAHRPVKGLAGYSASKAALLSLSQCVAQEVEGTGIRVLSFSIGGMNTPMRLRLFGPEDAEAQQRPHWVAGFIVGAVENQDWPNGTDFVIRKEKATARTWSNEEERWVQTPISRY